MEFFGLFGSWENEASWREIVREKKIEKERGGEYVGMQQGKINHSLFMEYVGRDMNI